MAVKVLLPQFGESVVEGTITKWLKAEGEVVEEYEPLVEVNTDKVDTEVPSPASGTLLKVLVGEGITAEAGTLLAWIGEPGESLPAGEEKGKLHASIEIPIAETETVLPSEADAPAPRPGRRAALGFISPVVARMAQEHNLDLGQLHGTGLDGRITKNDVLAYLAAGGAPVGRLTQTQVLVEQTSLDFGQR